MDSMKPLKLGDVLNRRTIYGIVVYEHPKYNYIGAYKTIDFDVRTTNFSFWTPRNTFIIC